jgi:hypothetical protein
MADKSSLPEKDVESAEVTSVSHETGWKRAVRRVERSLGIEAQGVSRVHESE